jgi:patatin-like phospholipase/acyl hydrolase
MKKILSIDAGGMRGIIPAIILAEIEARAGRPVCQLFDFFAGTSTGGMLALGLNCPASADCLRPLSSATDVRMAVSSVGKSLEQRRQAEPPVNYCET